MADVFISYATPDREVAARLAHVLDQHGITVWWDRKIAFGSVFDQAIEKELDSAKVVVTLWSHHSVLSEWVRNETSIAAERSVLIPARIDDCKLPLEFRRRQTADLTRWRGTDDASELSGLLSAIGAMHGGDELARRLGIAGKQVSAAVGAALREPAVSVPVVEPAPRREENSGASAAPGSFYQRALAIAPYAFSAMIIVSLLVLTAMVRPWPGLDGVKARQSKGVQGVDWASEKIVVGPGKAKKISASVRRNNRLSTFSAGIDIYIDGNLVAKSNLEPSVETVESSPGLHEVLVTCFNLGPDPHSCVVEISDVATREGKPAD